MENKLIIIGEDIPVEMELFKSVLEKYDDFILKGFDNGQDLYDYVITLKEMPSLIFLDVNMPRLSGLDTLYKLKETDIYCPIIMLSTSIEPRDVNKAYQYGCNSYLVKPIEYDEFDDMINKVLHYWIHINKLCYKD